MTHSPSPTPTGGRTARILVRLLVFCLLFGAVGWILRGHFALSALRLDLRHALGVDKGDDGFKPRAVVVQELKPAPPELIDKLKKAPRESVVGLLQTHFQSLAQEKDWHILDIRTTQRRIRALDLATSLGLVAEVRNEIQMIDLLAKNGADRYKPSDLKTTSTLATSSNETTSLAAIRDRQFQANAQRVHSAARLILQTHPDRSVPGVK